MPQPKGDGPAEPDRSPTHHPDTGTDDALQEANRRLLMAALAANEERDALAALAAAMREMLEKGGVGDQQLRSEIELLRSITANVSSALVLLDARGYPIFINPAGQTMFGYGLTELEGTSFHLAVHHHYPDGRPFSVEDCTVEGAIEADEPLRDHLDAYVRKDGTFLPVRCDRAVLRLAGLRVGIVLEFRDRSAEARAEEAKRDFVALIAHDLRTPLTSVQGHVQLLQRRLIRDGGSEPGEPENLEAIAQAARRMDLMIQELLDASRLESGIVPLHRAPVDISALVALVVEQLAAGVERARVTVRTSTPAVIAFADGPRLERVVVNLLSNALKYSPPTGPVRVDVRRGDGEAIVEVVDRGAGIPSDRLPLLFQRFARLERPHPDPGGVGLGLYIARLIAEAHGGRVWAESEVGTGSTIGFAIPLDVSDRASAEQRGD